MREFAPGAYVLVINLIAFVVYTWDKSLARAGKRRVSENNLLFLALFGGWIGALLACYLRRHKVRKTSFIVPLWIIAILETGLLLYSLVYGPPDFLVELMDRGA